MTVELEEYGSELQRRSVTFNNASSEADGAGGAVGTVSAVHPASTRITESITLNLAFALRIIPSLVDGFRV
jgi:hypothetical protein